jgi:hypothetical protein
MAGLAVWYGGYQGAAPWAYQMFTERGMETSPPKMEFGWDDWIPNEWNYRQMSYAYPGQTTPVPTIQYEAFREGVDDVKYLELLEQKVKELEKKTLNEKGKKIVIEAKAWLDAPSKKYHGTYYSLKDSLKAKDFEEFRNHTTKLILAIEKMLPASN